MKEITRIINAQVTIIERMNDAEADNVVSSQKDVEKYVENTLKKHFNADDVQVEINDFVMDKDGVEDGRCEVDQDNNGCI